MRLVHLSDLHLGFRQFQRQTPTGINQREADVAAAFKRAVDKIIALAPDLVLIAGDTFHSVRPTNPSILHAFQQFGRLVHGLPRAIVIVIAGNHDTPRATETGCILRLFSQLGIHVVDSEPQRLSFPEHELSVLAVPFSWGAQPVLDPDPNARRNVLVLHAAFPGITPAYLLVDRAIPQVSLADIKPDQWDYAALGHHHVYHEIAPNVCFSGALDYTTTDIWGEQIEERGLRLPGKGIIEFDLETHKRHFHHLPVARGLIDLPEISARGLSSADVDARIRDNVANVTGGIEDKIARQVVRNIPRHVTRELDQKALREYKRRALHFHLDTRRPDIIRTIGQGSPGRRPSLAEIVRDAIQRRVLPRDLSRERLVELGLHYLTEAEATETVSIAEGDLDA